MRALITGITGQDGSYLAERLVADGVEVHGTTRDVSAAHEHLRAIRDRVQLHACDLGNVEALELLVARCAPDRCFHFASQSYIGGEDARMGFNIASTFALLDAVSRQAPRARVLVAGSAAQVAGAASSPQNELTPSAPTSTYGLAKQLSADAVRFFREQRGMHACTAILYNHESARRSMHFISKKLARGAARISLGLQTHVEIGDLGARRDWGYAPDYVEGMALLLEHPTATDVVFATGRSHTVEEMADLTFAAAGLKARDHLVVRDDLVRRSDPVLLVGNAARANQLLGWAPRMPFVEMLARMVSFELAALRS